MVIRPQPLVSWLFSNSVWVLYLLYKEFVYLLAGVQMFIVIMKELFILLMVTSTFYLKMEVKSLTGMKSDPSGTLTGAHSLL